MSPRQARRTQIRALLARGDLATQEELRDALLRQGIEVTQATVSRDLSALRARRARRPDGSVGYEVPPEELADGTEEGSASPERVAVLVEWIASNEGLVVVHTAVGAASAVAREIDVRRVRGVLASLAGDDTVLVVPAAQRQTRAVERRLMELFDK